MEAPAASAAHLEVPAVIPPVVDRSFLTDHPDAVLADVRWYLDGRSGRDAWLGGHLPGAVFVDLNTVLAAPPSAKAGRHPLPEPEVFAAGLAELGIGEDDTIVAYDDAGGASAARLVWLLRNVGVEAALLDGGIAAWDGPLEEGPTTREPATFAPRPWDAHTLATIDDATTAYRVIDARAGARYRGDTEPVDARAGHIPGAINVPYGGNLDAEGRFLPPAALRERFEAAGVTDAAGVIVYCGSGVTACHDLLALEHAGLGRASLYPGSWSQYAATTRPMVTGEEPGQAPPVDPDGVIR